MIMNNTDRGMISVSDDRLRHLQMTPNEYLKEYRIREEIFFTHMVYAYKHEWGLHRWRLSSVTHLPLPEKYLNALREDDWVIFDYVLDD